MIAVEVIDVQTFRIGARSSPTIKLEVAPAMPVAGDDHISSRMPGNVADSPSAQVQLNGAAEPGGLGLDDLVGVKQGDEQGFACWNGIAEANQQLAFRHGRKAFNVQSVGVFGRAMGGFRKMELIESGIPEQIVQQQSIRCADSGEGNLSSVYADIGCKQAVTVETLLSIQVAPVRTDPEGAIADPGCALQIHFSGLALDFQKGVEIKLLHRLPRLIAAIEAQDIVLVIRDNEEI